MQQIDRFIRRRDALKMLSVSAATVDRLVAEGRLPPPTRLTPRCVGWPESVLVRLMHGEADAQ